MSVAGPPVTPRPPTVPVTWLVVLTASVPWGAEAGTWRTTSKVQVPPPARLPPVRVRSEAPESWEPAPQTSGRVPLTLARPERAASRSSVKVRSAAGSDARFSIVNRRVTVPPGATGSSTNSFSNRSRLSSTVRKSVAFGKRTVSPSTVALKPVVVLE